MNPRFYSRNFFGSTAAVVFTAFMIAMTWMAPSADAASGQPGCAKFKKQIKKSKTSAKKRLAKARFKQCKADAFVRNRIGNSHFVGVRSDGISVDTIYCRNGTVHDSPGLGKPWKNGWRIEDARVKNGKNFTGIMYTPIKGGAFVQSVAFKNGQWQVGYEYGGQPQALGDMTRTNASKECRSL
jgi:hypothetical protein